MVVADGYPIMGVFMSMLFFFAWILFIWLVITVFMDLFRRDDISGWGKAAWIIFALVLPYIGVFVYVIAEGKAMAKRTVDRAQRRHDGMDEYIKTVSATAPTNSADEIAKAHELLDSGAITQEEYEAMKKKVLVG